MAPIPVTEVLLGVYLGLLAGIFPAFIAFAIGFSFRYFTNVTVPGLGVVVLGGALAGISGGLMGLVDPSLAENWTGITAVLVVLMFTLWAHAQGDKLAVATPRRLTLGALRTATLSADILDRVDSFGQVRIQPVGEVQDIGGYPPLPEDLREALSTAAWKFPANLPLTDLEARLEERLLSEYEVAEVSVAIDAQGRATVAAAPRTAGLSRRVPAGTRAVSVSTLLPTGLARGDRVTVELPDGDVSGPVVSARTAGAGSTPAATPTDADAGKPDATTVGGPAAATGGRPAAATGGGPAAATGGGPDAATATPRPEPSRAPTTTGGAGQVTIAAAPGEARRVIRADFAPVVVHSRGKQREYETIALLAEDGNRFRKLTLAETSPLAGQTLGAAQVRDRYGVAILGIRRARDSILSPGGATELAAGDVLFAVGPLASLDDFEGVTA